MRKVLVMVLCIISISTQAQKFQWVPKEMVTPLSLTFAAGAASGMRDVCLFHFNNGSSWWNSKTSWMRKYKNGDARQGPAFFGSTSVFVSLTDGAHFFNMVQNQFDAFALATAPAKEKNFGRILKRALLYEVTRNIGRIVVYNVVFKAKNY